MLGSFLREQLQAVLRLPAPPAANVGFFDLGMDSLMAVEFRNRLNRAFSGEYTAPNTLVFDYPNVEALGGHLARELAEIAGAAPPATEPEPEPVRTAVNEDDTVAIVGMACRFPGAADLDAFWRLLETGAHAVTEGWRDPGSGNPVPADPAGADGASRWGAFVDGIDRFDARFFGILPIAARLMDPQQRLLLEVSWQALEDAAVDPDRLRGGRGGVYAGIATSEYRELMESGRIGVNYLGTSGSMAVGGVAFRLGLMGPAMPVMLNCASSLVAVHHAVAALRQGETDLALAGGVNAVLSRGLTAEMGALGMLSPTGKCATFDAAADGAIRGEGCGMVVLKRLRDAVADGDRIWGLIRGSAVNQNGATAGPTVPNGPAQERVIEEALSGAGVSPADVDYLEAHGAGSELGDPIEVRAVAAVYGRERDADRPLLIGSVKTNIGHLESAAGIAGLIKTVLAMNRRVIPRHLHFRNPTPHLDWDRLPVRVTSEAAEWPVHSDRPARAAVSAFGISGANAHVVLEGRGTPDGAPDGRGMKIPVSIPATGGEPPPAGAGPAIRKTRFLPLAARTHAALRKSARRYLEWLDERAGEPSSGNVDDGLLADLAWTAAVGRSHFAVRAGVVFRDADGLKNGLTALAEPDGTRRTEPAPQPPGKIAFTYTGKADGWVSATGELYESEPVFRAVLDRCEGLIREERGASVLDAMYGGKPSPPLESGEMSRPALYAVQCGLTALWSSIGIRPRTAAGRGAGELAAAQAAGALGLEDGLRLAAAGETGHREGRGDPELLEDSEVMVEIGPGAVPGRTPRLAVVLPAFPPPSGDGAGPTSHEGFVGAVAAAYTAGLSISFDGLFAGETRRRISLPGYPFERRRYWIQRSSERV